MTWCSCYYFNIFSNQYHKFHAHKQSQFFFFFFWEIQISSSLTKTGWVITFTLRSFLSHHFLHILHHIFLLPKHSLPFSTSPKNLSSFSSLLFSLQFWNPNFPFNHFFQYFPASKPINYSPTFLFSLIFSHPFLPRQILNSPYLSFLIWLASYSLYFMDKVNGHGDKRLRIRDLKK